MTIRKKLMILLFTITLIPMLVIIILYQMSIRYVSDKVSDDILTTLEEAGRYNMQQMLDEYESTFRLNGRLLETLIQLQVREVEEALARPAVPKKLPAGPQFGMDTTYPEPVMVIHDYRKISPDGTQIPLPVSFRRQDFLITAPANPDYQPRDLQKLSGMTSEYHRIYQNNPQMIFWQYTALETGLHTSYPSGAEFPDNYNPRQRGWYQGARKQNGMYWSPPYLDALTGRPMLSLSAPVYYPDRSFAGVTGIDILLTSLFQWVDLNPRWARNAIGMLIYPEGLESSGPLKIFASMNYQDSTVIWNQDLAMTSLVSPDQEEFSSFIQDFQNGRSGIRVMPYQARKSYWVYQGIGDKRIYPLFIIPYENVTTLAEETDTYLFKKNFENLRYTILVIFIVIGIIIWLSINRSRVFTRPIDALAAAGKKLAEGDYQARANIGTGDELQQLGNVFNQIGPKLQEHQKMQQSLELARTIQQRLLPRSTPQLQNFDIAGMCRYSDETGGDYYDFISLEEIEPGKFSIVLGDVTGHGIGAALLMASARSVLRNNIRHYQQDLSKILFEFNNEITRDTDPDKFITLFLGLVDNNSCSLTWGLGGHDPAIWYQSDKDDFKELTSAGVPIGFVPDVTFEQAGPVTLKKGDLVLVGTDGIWEAHNQQEEMFGKQRLLDLIKESREKSAGEICQEVIRRVLEFSQPHPQEDDITAVVIKAL